MRQSFPSKALESYEQKGYKGYCKSYFDLVNMVGKKQNDF